ncbi:MAG: hypothetical protein KBD31_05045 [Proteobacteria bacterium]|nr:hypothetical protein [Pseudomonadota bacterium]
MLKSKTLCLILTVSLESVMHCSEMSIERSEPPVTENRQTTVISIERSTLPSDSKNESSQLTSTHMDLCSSYLNSGALLVQKEQQEIYELDKKQFHRNTHEIVRIYKEMEPILSLIFSTLKQKNIHEDHENWENFVFQIAEVLDFNPKSDNDKQTKENILKRLIPTFHSHLRKINNFVCTNYSQLNDASKSLFCLFQALDAFFYNQMAVCGACLLEFRKIWTLKLDLDVIIIHELFDKFNKKWEEYKNSLEHKNQLDILFFKMLTLRYSTNDSTTQEQLNLIESFSSNEQLSQMKETHEKLYKHYVYECIRVFSSAYYCDKRINKTLVINMLPLFFENKGVFLTEDQKELNGYCEWIQRVGLAYICMKAGKDFERAYQNIFEVDRVSYTKTDIRMYKEVIEFYAKNKQNQEN